MPSYRTLSRRGAMLLAGAAIALAALAPAAARAAQAMIVGTPHLAQLAPVPDVAQRELVVRRLATFRPSLVCVEAMPGERVQQFAAEPQRHGELLQGFALDAVRLAPEQQVRLALDAGAAREAARALEGARAPLDGEERLRLVSLQLAAYEPWSALLNWSLLSPPQQAAASLVLGRFAVARLQELAKSDNEIVSLALPLARRLGHRRLCSVDSFVDEVAVQDLANALTPMLADPAIPQGLERFNREQARHWRAQRGDGLAGLLGWINSEAFSATDRAAQWEIFARGEGGHAAGLRRLALWHARNADIVAHLYRALASPEGERTLLLIGAAHRPFLEQALRAQPWIGTVSAARALAGT